MQYNTEAKRPNFLFPKGEYPAQVIEAEEKTSRAGNPMLVVRLEAYHGDAHKFITDYIVLGGEHSQDWKLGHLAVACSLPKNGELRPEQIIGRLVRVKVKVKPAKDAYPEDNAIDDYLSVVAGDVTQVEEERAAPIRPALASLANDEPPF